MIEIGGIIRSIRKKRDMSITELANKIDISVGYISQIERNLVSPSLVTVEKIADTLEVPISLFFSDDEGVYSYVKKEERRSICFEGRTWDLLIDNSKTKLMSAYIARDALVDDVIHSHKGTELFYCLEGKSQCFIGSEEYMLQEGDSLYFDATVPHWGGEDYPGPRKILVIAVPAEEF